MRVILNLTLALALQFALPMSAVEVRVFAAASLTDVLKEVARAYEKESGDKVVFNFAASNFLARQIEAGAPADIFFSADEAQMDLLEKKNLVATETRRNRLSNSLAIVVAADSAIAIGAARDLAKLEIKRIALADPAGVPAGIYAKQFLERQNLWSPLEKKIVPTENVRGALAAVESGNVEAAIVYRTDVAVSKKTKIAFEIPCSETPAIHYPVAILKDSTQSAAAKKFLDYLFSSAATALFQRYGFMTEL
jgi:molybdate transport system substrate-binding protein